MVGLSDEGTRADRASVREACITHLAVHFAFSALMIDDIGSIDGVDSGLLLARRARLGRAGIDLALSLV